MKRALAIMALALPLYADNSSNWSTALSQVTLPSAITSSESGIRGLGGASNGINNGNVYVGTSQGVYVGNIACIEANPADQTCWSTINTGLPASVSGADPYLTALHFAWTNGHLSAAFFDYSTAHHAKTGFWNGTTWTLNTVDPGKFDTGGISVYGSTLDGSGNWYVASSTTIYRSADGGITWTDLCAGDCWTKFSISPVGTFMALDIWNATMYWGGDGTAGVFSSPISMASKTNLLATPTYTGNYFGGTETDGNATVGATSEINSMINLASGNLSQCQHFNVGTSTWSNCANVTFPGGCNTLNWSVRKVRQGTAAHEVYYTGGNTSNCKGIVGSIDGGATWSPVGSSVATNGNNGSAFYYLVIATDDSKWMASQGGGGQATSLFFHPAPVANTAGGSTIGGTIGGKVVIQ